MQGRPLGAILLSHAVWGSMPLYLLLVHKVPAIEYVAWRTLFTLPLCLLFVAVFDSAAELREVLGDRRTLFTLMGSAALVAINWFMYVWAIQSGYVYAASLGYYILPLTMMVLGMIFLGERLNRLQWLAVAMATIGVATLAAGAITTLALSMAMALTFGLYGLLRKTVKAGSLVGLTVESMLLLPVVGAILAWSHMSGPGLSIGREAVETAGIVMGGPMTAIPLILFAYAARALPYTVIGFLQFISPTIVFLIGLFVFGEPLKPAQLACFVAIWIAAAIFVYDLFRRKRPVPQAAGEPVA